MTWGKNKMRRIMMTAVAVVILVGGLSSGCVRVKVDPIHITMDVNVKMDRELDSFFGDLDAAAKKAAPAPAGAAAEPTPQNAKGG